MRLEDIDNASERSSGSVISITTRKRRGRKRERDDVYFVKGNKKIEAIKLKLKTEGKDMTVTER